MEVVLVVMLIIGLVVFRRMKAAAEEQQARQARLQQQEHTRMTSHYDPEKGSPAPQVPGQIHFSSVLPDKKPPVVPVRKDDPRMEFKPTEGVAFHPPGFHGDEKPRVNRSMEKKPLEKADLGAERARQNVHTAENANWTAPEESSVPVQVKTNERQPMYTAKQLRDAFIMQEILDEPVSRRKGIKRGYGS